MAFPEEVLRPLLNPQKPSSGGTKGPSGIGFEVHTHHACWCPIFLNGYYSYYSSSFKGLCGRIEVPRGGAELPKVQHHVTAEGPLRGRALRAAAQEEGHSTTAVSRLDQRLGFTRSTPFGCGSTPMGSHFGVGEFTTHFRTYFGDWDVHWGYGIWILTHGHLGLSTLFGVKPFAFCWF